MATHQGRRRGRSSVGLYMLLAIGAACYACSSDPEGGEPDEDGGTAGQAAGGSSVGGGGGAHTGAGHGGSSDASGTDSGGMAGHAGDAGVGGLPGDDLGGATAVGGAGGDILGDAGAAGAPDSEATPKHRWLIYTTLDRDVIEPCAFNTPSCAPQSSHTWLADTSKPGIPSEVSPCGPYGAGEKPFSPDGKWLACGALYDMLGEHPVLTQADFAGLWSPDSAWTARFVDSVATPQLSFSSPLNSVASLVDMSGMSDCTIGTWSPGGALFSFSCAGTVYVVSPRWSARPIVPLSIGAGTFVEFVSDEVVVLTASTQHLGWSRVTGAQASPVAELAAPATPVGFVSASSSPTTNPSTERAILSLDGVAALVDFRRQPVTAVLAALASPNLAYFFGQANGNPTGELFSSDMPAGPSIATIDTPVFWSADSRAVFTVEGSRAGITWMKPTVHSEQRDPDYPAYTTPLFGADGSWFVYPDMWQGHYFVVNLDPVAGHIVHSNGIGDAQFQVVPVVAPSRAAFAAGGCVYDVLPTGPVKAGCAPQGGTNGIDPEFGYQRSAALQWSADSSTVAAVFQGPAPAAGNALPTHGLVVFGVDNPTNATIVVQPSVGILMVYKTLVAYAMQP